MTNCDGTGTGTDFRPAPATGSLLGNFNPPRNPSSNDTDAVLPSRESSIPLHSAPYTFSPLSGFFDKTYGVTGIGRNGTRPYPTSVLSAPPGHFRRLFVCLQAQIAPNWFLTCPWFFHRPQERIGFLFSVLQLLSVFLFQAPFLRISRNTGRWDYASSLLPLIASPQAPSHFWLTLRFGGSFSYAPRAFFFFFLIPSFGLEPPPRS